MKHVWVVEMWNEYANRGKGEWKPCSDCALSKDKARWKLKEWKDKDPNDKFRIQHYDRKETKR